MTGVNRRGGATRARPVAKRSRPEMTAAERRATIAAALAEPLPLGAQLVDYDAWSEDDLYREMLSLATALDGELQAQHPDAPGMRFKMHHETDSRRTVAGYLDVTAAAPAGQLWAELKRQPTVKTPARPTPAQTEWIDTLSLGGAAVFVWRPYDWRDGTVQREMYRIAGLEMPARRTAVPMFDDGRRRASCGCLINDEWRIPVHTCTRHGGTPP